MQQLLVLNKTKSCPTIPWNKLKTYEFNALKEAKDRDVTKLKNSIVNDGFRFPMFIWADHKFVIDGAGRDKALLELEAEGYQIEDVPVVEIEAENKREAKMLALQASSKYGDITEQSYGDFTLDMELTEPDFGKFDLGLDFSMPEVEELAPVEEDEAPEPQEDPTTKMGDIWLCGPHRVMCGDSTVITDVDKLMAGEKADIVYTDPPYGIDEKGDRSKRNGKNSLRQGVKYDDFKDDSIQYAIDAYSICEGLGIPRQVWWGANYYCHSLPQSNNWFIWDKRIEDKQKDFNSDCEMAWVKSEFSSIRIFRHLWKGLIKGSEHGQARVHPTQKPIALAVWAFDYFKNVTSVLDLFGGSGSTLIAAEQTKRKCYTMELDPRYCDVIVKRYIKLTGNEAILEGTQEIFPYNKE